MYKNIHLLTTLVALLGVSHHAVRGTTTTDVDTYFILDVGEAPNDVGKDEIKAHVQYVTLLIHRDVPKELLCAWINDRHYEVLTMRDADQQYQKPCQNPAAIAPSFFTDSQAYLASEEKTKTFLQQNQHDACMLMHADGEITARKLNDSDLTRPFCDLRTTSDQDATPNTLQDPTIYVIAFIVGVIYFSIQYMLGEKPNAA